MRRRRRIEKRPDSKFRVDNGPEREVKLSEEPEIDGVKSRQISCVRWHDQWRPVNASVNEQFIELIRIRIEKRE